MRVRPYHPFCAALSADDMTAAFVTSAAGLDQLTKVQRTLVISINGSDWYQSAITNPTLF